MEKNEILKEILGLPLAEQREIFESLRERLAVDEAGGGSQKGSKKRDPWGVVYQELSKTFRRPATP